MENHVVDTYENYKEENRLTTNNARKIEFETTIRVMEEWIGTDKKILDCAAGTGVYAFHFADRGHDVTATDITPRHVEIMNKTLQEKHYKMQTAVLDATDMSMFADESFDVVFNMGPMYHLIDEEKRNKCMEESLRVLKKGGLIFTAYISRYYIFQYIAMHDKQFLDYKLAEQLMQTGILRHEDEKCFWTDSYYATKKEMEELYRQKGVEIVDHFSQDGLTPMFASVVDTWSEEEFRIWCDHHYSVCREESTLGASNHVIIVGRK